MMRSKRNFPNGPVELPSQRVKLKCGLTPSESHYDSAQSIGFAEASVLKYRFVGVEHVGLHTTLKAAKRRCTSRLDSLSVAMTSAFTSKSRTCRSIRTAERWPIKRRRRAVAAFTVC